jgi:hypothetical protein
MTHTITLQQYRAVRRALGCGLRHCEIARELGLCVDTIARIADERRYRADGENPRADELPADDGPPDYVATNLRRCPGCGAMVYLWPCRACEMATTTQPVPPAAEVDDAPDEASRLTAKQKRWRRRQIVQHVFGKPTRSRVEGRNP